MKTTGTTTGDESARWVGRAGIGAVSLVAANAGLAWIYFHFDLTLYQLVLVYWWECLWIGLFSAFKLLVASAIGDPYSSRYVSSTPGGRVVLSIVLIVSLSAVFGSLLGLTGMSLLWVGEALPGSGEADRAINHIGLILGSSLLFLLGHGLSFVVNFLALGEFRHARAGTLLLLPFKRCLALFTCIAIAIGVVIKVPALASARAFAAIVIVLKILWDVWLHLRERRDFADPVTAC